MAANLQHQESLRQRMVADIAHELRTPLSVIQGNLQAILDNVYPLTTEEVRTIYSETELLSRLVTDLHDLAQAEAGQLLLTRQQISVTNILGRMAEIFRPMADQKGVKLTTLPPNPDVSVSADPDRLQQVFHNLLGNAFRHTPPGGQIELGAKLGSAGSARFWVQNTGAGIAADQLPFVFDRFYRIDRSRSRSDGYTSGAGLGLAIAKAIIESHGGTVGADSRLGIDVVFWFELPVAPQNLHQS